MSDAEHDLKEDIGPADAAFIRCVERLQELIGDETSTLRAGAHIDLDTLNLRKTHALLEFARMARNRPQRGGAEVEDRLLRLRELLAANARVLEQHLQAMTEITNILVESIRKDVSDGTYSRGSASRR